MAPGRSAFVITPPFNIFEINKMDNVFPMKSKAAKPLLEKRRQIRGKRNVFPMKSKEFKSLLEQNRQIREENCDPLDLPAIFVLQLDRLYTYWYLISLDDKNMDDMWAIRWGVQPELVSVKLSSLLSMASTLGSTMSAKRGALCEGKIARNYIISFYSEEDDDEEDDC